MELAFVTPTLGRIPELQKLLTSLQGELRPGDECIIVAQGNFTLVQALVSEFAKSGMPIRCIESPRGAALGRNWGARAVSGPNPLLIFPNDSSWFPAETIRTLRLLPESFEFGSMTMFDENGARFTLPATGTQLDRWNAWKILEATLVIRKRPFVESGGFDESLGTGARTPWQAGEATDLVLRACLPSSEDFYWLPPTVSVWGIPEGGLSRDSDRRKKLRAYGRGTGRVLGSHGYPLYWRCAFVLAGLLAGARSPSYRASDGLWAFVGRLEGVLGFTFGASGLTAVKK
jgi:hypothetical protein